MKTTSRRDAGTAAWAAALLWAAAVPAAAQVIYPAAGTTSAVFLKVPEGSRPVGMGEAFTGVAGDPDGLLWNPASIATVPTRVLTGTYNQSFADIQNEYVSYVHPLAPTRGGDRCALAFHALSLIPPNQEFRDGTGEGDVFNPVTSPQGSFGAYDLALGASYAQTLGDLWSAGGTFHVIRQAIGSDHAQTAAVDLGLLRKTSLPGLTLGGSILNFGPGLSFGTTYDLPLTFRAGAAYQARRNLLFTADASKPIDDYPFLSAGAEFLPFAGVAVRAGYHYRVVGNALGAFSGVRLGLGLKIGKVRVDYAFSPFGDLGTSNRLSIGIPWGGAPERPAEAPAPQPLPKMASLSEPAVPLPPAIAPVLASTAPAGPFKVVLRPRAITPQGTVFDVSAEAAEPGRLLESVSFKAVLPTLQPIGFTVAESSEAAGFDVLPSSFTFLRLVKLAHGVRGEIRAPELRFVLPAEALPAGCRPEKVTVFRVHDGEAAPQATSLKDSAGGRLVYEVWPDFLGDYWILAAEKPK